MSDRCAICGRAYCSVKDLPMTKHALNGSWSKHWRLGYERLRAALEQVAMRVGLTATEQHIAYHAHMITAESPCPQCAVVSRGLIPDAAEPPKEASKELK